MTVPIWAAVIVLVLACFGVIYLLGRR